jgi:transposase
VIRVAERKAGHADSWLARLTGRRNKNVAAVALASKNARVVWALLLCAMVAARCMASYLC